MDKINIGLHWFRRDLRILDNKALQYNWKVNQGNVLGIFCFDSTFIKRSDFSHNRFSFFLNTLESLKEEFKLHGGELLVVDTVYSHFFSHTIDLLNSHPKFKLNLITWNNDYEPYARKRDSEVELTLKNKNILFKIFRDHLIFEPKEISKKNTTQTYQVFTPFSKQWLEIFFHENSEQRFIDQKKVNTYYKNLQDRAIKPSFTLKWDDLNPLSIPEDSLEIFKKKNEKYVTIPIPAAGSLEAFKQLTSFKKKISTYHFNRDVPSLDHTSKISIFLKNGSITTSQIISILNLRNHSLDDGLQIYLKEIIWREFYYHIIYHHPRVESESFLYKFINLKWENSQIFFQAWCTGQTGFPIIDAGMRQLNQTGWMHNRIRMIVASFLTKDLLIDWRWGENYFMNKLLDGDLAPNNGGWQWAASTGCDPQPYFRIFNPWLQSKKFDPDGEYIKKFIPELKNVNPKLLHEPPKNKLHDHYPLPIIEHDKQKLKALDLYKL